jgi:hypothetical protein
MIFRTGKWLTASSSASFIARSGRISARNHVSSGISPEGFVRSLPHATSPRRVRSGDSKRTAPGGVRPPSTMHRRTSTWARPKRALGECFARSRMLSLDALGVNAPGSGVHPLRTVKIDQLPAGQPLYHVLLGP